MSPGFTVWVTGPDERPREAVASAIAARLAARGVPTETLDHTTPGIETLSGDGLVARIAFVASILARQGVATVVAVPADHRAERTQARGVLGRMIEVYVEPAARMLRAGYEPPTRSEVEITVPDTAAGIERTLATLEILKLLPPRGAAYSEAEEREVIRRLKGFGYL